MNNQELMLTRIRQDYLQLKFLYAVEAEENNWVTMFIVDSFS